MTDQELTVAGLFGDPISPADRRELVSVIRLRANVAKSDIEARRASLLADFEEQISAQYEVDDERWASITAKADQFIKDADEQIRVACTAAGIPEQFRPGIILRWYNRGENAMKERRTELRRAAERRLEAQAKKAKVEVDRTEAQLRSDLASRSVTSDQARAFIAGLPSVDALMPRLDLKAIDAATPNRHGLYE